MALRTMPDGSSHRLKRNASQAAATVMMTSRSALQSAELLLGTSMVLPLVDGFTRCAPGYPDANREPETTQLQIDHPCDRVRSWTTCC